MPPFPYIFAPSFTENPLTHHRPSHLDDILKIDLHVDPANICLAALH